MHSVTAGLDLEMNKLDAVVHGLPHPATSKFHGKTLFKEKCT